MFTTVNSSEVALTIFLRAVALFTTALDFPLFFLLGTVKIVIYRILTEFAPTRFTTRLSCSIAKAVLFHTPSFSALTTLSFVP